MVVATREANEHQRPLAQRFVVPRQGLGRARVAPFQRFSRGTQRELLPFDGE